MSIMVDLEERILEDIEMQSRIWWGYMSDIFFIWEHEEDAEWSTEETKFFDVNVRLRNR